MTPDTGHRMRSPDTWDAARQAYLEGGSARDICDRYDLTLSAFRARARREGWRRADMADPDPGPEDAFDDLDDDSPLPSLEDMAAVAWRRAVRALGRGRAGDTQRWMAIHARLQQQIRTHEEADMIDRARRACRTPGGMPLREAVDSAPGLHQLHQLHRAASEPAPPGPDSPAPPLSRAEHRRLEKLRRKR